MSKLFRISVLGTFALALALGVAAPVSIDLASGDMSIAQAMAKHGADDGAVVDDHGDHGAGHP